MNFCALILCPVALLYLFIVSNSFSVESLGCCMYRIMPSAKSDTCTSSFPIWMPFYVFLLSDCSG